MYIFTLYNCSYTICQMVYCGANLCVHTMWPHEKMLQWHTLHHTVLADIYNVNIPSELDKQRSRDFGKFNEALSVKSPFVRIPWLSDAAAGGFIVVFGVLFHYVLGWGVTHVWDEAQWNVG